jgi:hypothetical protein
MSIFLLMLAQAVASNSVPVPFASAASVTCNFLSEDGKKQRLTAKIDPIIEATGYGSAKFTLIRDDTGLMTGANSAMLTGSTKPPRWYQVAVPVAGGRENMLQFYLYPKGAKGVGFITLQEGGLRIGGYGVLAAGMCESEFGAVK